MYIIIIFYFGLVLVLDVATIIANMFRVHKVVSLFQLKSTSRVLSNPGNWRASYRECRNGTRIQIV